MALDARTRPLAKSAFESVKRQRWDQAASFARQTGDGMIIDAVEWYSLIGSSQIADFPRIARFLAKHPDWPQKDLLVRRAEIALLSGGYGDQATRDWLSANPPQTTFGKYKYLTTRGQALSNEVIINTWIEGDMTQQEEAAFLARHRSVISNQYTIARASRLIWEGKYGVAKKYIASLPATHQALMNARIALLTDSKNANGLLSRVPATLKDEEGLLYARAVWRKKHKLWDNIAEMVMKAPANSVYASKWWPYRHIAIREALAKQQYTLAENLAARFGVLDRVDEAEALWLRGWIALSYRGKPSAALEDFKRLHSISQYPISKARGAYWAGLAAKRLGDNKRSQEWMYTASKYPTSFYGQLAAEELYSHLQVTSAKEASMAQVDAYAKRTPMAMLVLMMAEADAAEMSVPFINHLMHATNRKEDRAAIVGLGIRANRPDLSIRAAKEAMRYDLYYMQTGYPIVAVPPNVVVEPQLIHAFTRQESMFYPRATSPADAKGLMQILPSTGKTLARRVGIGFSPATLYEPMTNMRLGSYYLAELQDRFNGSLPMTAAGYNAGPGRPIQWSRQFGRPGGGDLLRSLNWLEMIPFSETRNYVQRVMENYQVYRWKFGQGTAKLNMKTLLAQ